MGKIVLLDDLTINQIAAGEVIERPASVVKELVENSIDAGAKNVTVEIKNGGISYIRVTDDGSGILPDDMEIAFERHATSKIRQASDLEEVKSMGFRGEALASIASIAKVELVSKTEDSEIGYKVEAVGGDVTDKHEEGASKGTTITISELFYNTPVRYKFLKKDFTEAGYIEDIINKIALANPDVAIKLINGGKTVVQTNGSGQIVDVIYSIFGKEVSQNILDVDYEYEDMHVTGVIGKPLLNRSNRSNQIFFVNNRPVKDKTLTSATEQAFKGLTMIGKHPFAILNLEMDPKLVDVNVHPTKLEIRFQEEQKVFKAIYHAIKETLLKSDLISDPNKDYSAEEDEGKEVNKEITNKDRLAAWSLNKEDDKSEEKEVIDTKPNFDEFKSTMTNMDAEKRKEFMAQISNAKTTEEIIEGVKKFSSFVKEDAENVIANKDAAEDIKEKVEEDVKVEEPVKALEEDKEEIKDEVKENIAEEYADDKVEEKIEDKVEEKEEEFEAKNDEEIKDENKEEKFTGLTADDLKQINEESMDDVEVKEDINKDDTDNDNVEEEIKATEPVNVVEENKEEVKVEEPEVELSFEEMYKKMFGRDIVEAKKEYDEKTRKDDGLITPINNNELSLFEKKDEKVLPYRYVGIAFRTYIILTMNDELYFMDQHAAHERILYEKVKANFYKSGEKDSQIMLLPDVINLSNKEMGIYRDNKDMFARAGFIVEEFGENTLKLTGVPEFCLNFNTKEIFLETLDEIDTVSRTAKQEIEDKFLATVACKAAVKAHMVLSREEVDSLISQLIKLPNPFSCPHGRPTIIKMTKDDIEKKFHRKL